MLKGSNNRMVCMCVCVWCEAPVWGLAKAQRCRFLKLLGPCRSVMFSLIALLPMNGSNKRYDLLSLFKDKINFLLLFITELHCLQSTHISGEVDG